MTAPAHNLHPAAPLCLGCGDPMAPTPAGYYTCDHTGTTPRPYDLPLDIDQRPMRKRERRIRTTAAVDVWPGYQPTREKQPGDGLGAMARKRRQP
jgi:hypothetical protein